MRKTYRYRNNKDYWNQRWEQIAVDNPMENKNAYPLKYALMTIQSKDGKILEAGCGNGRVLRYFHKEGYNITGMDFIETAIEKIKSADPAIPAEVGNATALHYPDKSFRYLLAFGLYHNFDWDELDKALSESHRVLEKNGFLCASFRADNLQTRITDWLANIKSKSAKEKAQEKHFHKMNLTEGEFKHTLQKYGFVVQQSLAVENMPFLYKFKFFRSGSHKFFNENIARKEGYRLSSLGSAIQKILVGLFPRQFCNIYVIIAQKG